MQKTPGGLFMSARKFSACAILLFLAAPLPASADSLADNWALCHPATVGTVSAQKGIAACNALIASGALDKKDLASAYHWRAVANSANGNIDRAMEDMTTAISIYPTAERYANRANGWYAKKDYAHAIDDASAALRLDPANAFALQLRSRIYIMTGRMALGLSDLDTLVRLKPDNPDMLYLRSLARNETGNVDGAIADLTAAIRLNGANKADALQQRAILYADKKQRYELAMSDLNEAIRLKPDESSYYNSRCWQRAVLGVSLDKALEDCNTSLRLKPGVAGVLDSRALVHYLRGDYSAAIRDGNAAVSADTSLAGSYYVMGLAWRKKGDNATADYNIGIAKKRDPDIAKKYVDYGVTP